MMATREEEERTSTEGCCRCHAYKFAKIAETFKLGYELVRDSYVENINLLKNHVERWSRRHRAILVQSYLTG